MDAYPKQYLYSRIVRAKLFIDEHYAEKINLDEIADEAFFSKYHFLRLFKSICGKTPHQYLVHVRLTQAQRMLEEGKSVSETCLAVGFESMSSFSGLFRKQVGLSPSDFQRRHLARDAEIEAQPLAFIPGCFAAHNGWT